MLEIAWVYPVWKPTESGGSSSGATSAAQAERALPIEQAYELVTDGDKRPVLILRECDRCKGTDHALLSRSLDNEQTVLLTHWFRCVKLPTNVLTDKHPFYNLFKREKEGDRIPHLFFVDPDGANKRELPGDQPQTVLWETMFSYLERCYAESAKAAIKELRQLLSQYDKLDEEEKNVRNRLDKEIEKNGPDSPKVKKLEADLLKLAKDREKLGAKEKELRDLALKEMPAVGKPVPAGATEPAKPAGGS
ncbi:MAG: hypothetical protein MUC36_02485 [Planctomycetes bacterium]|jgi:hypothetical protein|nr:hypothetical protein [Planctomycetota bacterium]